MFPAILVHLLIGLIILGIILYLVRNVFTFDPPILKAIYAVLALMAIFWLLWEVGWVGPAHPVARTRVYTR